VNNSIHLSDPLSPFLPSNLPLSLSSFLLLPLQPPLSSLLLSCSPPTPLSLPFFLPLSFFFFPFNPLSFPSFLPLSFQPASFFPSSFFFPFTPSLFPPSSLFPSNPRLSSLLSFSPPPLLARYRKFKRLSVSMLSVLITKREYDELKETDIVDGTKTMLTNAC